ncbi:MAG: glycosyltransferase family 2 protein [Bryobacteraceae bacterium]|nr:glycosyltransferase family 2 protein [Bryobacteraceae bacterium]
MAFLSIVIPAYNEENRLPATLARLMSYLESTHLGEVEVLIVDDGSRDHTAALVEDFGRLYPSVRVVRNPGNQGKGYAVRNGVMTAQGDWILFSDADLSAPIEEVEKLLAAVREQNADGAIGSRALNRKLVSVHQSAFREYSGRFFNLMMRLITGLPYADTQCGFKLFRRDAAHAVFQRVRIPGFGFDVEALFVAQLLRYQIVEVPVRWANAEGTKVTMLNGLQAFSDLLRVRLYQVRGHYD